MSHRKVTKHLSFIGTSPCHSQQLTLLGCQAPRAVPPLPQPVAYSTSSLTALCRIVLVSPEAGRSWITDLRTKPPHPTSTEWTDAVQPASLRSAAGSDYFPSSQGTVSSTIRNCGRHQDARSKHISHSFPGVSSDLAWPATGLCWLFPGLTKGMPQKKCLWPCVGATSHEERMCLRPALIFVARGGALFFTTKPRPVFLHSSHDASAC